MGDHNGGGARAHFVVQYFLNLTRAIRSVESDGTVHGLKARDHTLAEIAERGGGKRVGTQREGDRGTLVSEVYPTDSDAVRL